MAKQDQYGHEFNDSYLFVRINVAGVTYKNGRRHRQTILRQIYWKDEPYQHVDGVDIVPTLYEGEPAVEIWVFNKNTREMIGYVPKKEASFVYQNFSLYDGYFDFEVFGGGTARDGTSLSYGASLVLRFQTPPGTVAVSSDNSAEEEDRQLYEAAQRALRGSVSSPTQKPASQSPKRSAAHHTKPQKESHPFFWTFVIAAFILGVASAIFK